MRIKCYGCTEFCLNKKKIIWLIWYSEVSDIIHAFTCASAIGILWWSICLGVNISILSPWIFFSIVSDTIVEYQSNNLITFSRALLTILILLNTLSFSFHLYLRLRLDLNIFWHFLVLNHQNLFHTSVLLFHQIFV